MEITTEEYRVLFNTITDAIMQLETIRDAKRCFLSSCGRISFIGTGANVSGKSLLRLCFRDVSAMV